PTFRGSREGSDMADISPGKITASSAGFAGAILFWGRLGGAVEAPSDDRLGAKPPPRSIANAHADRRAAGVAGRVAHGGAETHGTIRGARRDPRDRDRAAARCDLTAQDLPVDGDREGVRRPALALDPQGRPHRA